MKRYNTFNNKELNTLLLGRKGGPTSIRIIDAILERPLNAYQLSKLLKLDYKTITYHVTLFCESDFLIKEKEGYGPLFYPTKKLLDNINEYEKIKKIMKKTRK